MKFIPKEVPENINVTPHHPLLNFAYLLGTVVLVSVLIFFLLGLLGEWIATRLSPETESKIGQMLLQPFTTIEEDQRLDYLQTLLATLPQPGETIRMPLTVHLIEGDTVNAAIIAGGHVLIWTGLLKAVESENELAFILAHELGHFQARDPLKILGRSLVLMSALAIVGFGITDSLGADILSTTGQLTTLSYSRRQEQAADRYGLQRVLRRYRHIGYTLDFFKRLEQQEATQGHLLKVSQYFSTHPPSSERISYLEQLATDQGWAMHGDKIPLPDNLHCPNMEKCEEN